MRKLLGLIAALAVSTPAVVTAQECRKVCEESCSYGVCNFVCVWRCQTCTNVCGWEFDAFGRQVYVCRPVCR